eukprot:TRINITY_DN1135_c0_g1_i1.p1 TRINITY_DN1135_c0_g1~~TRINITY_DN1135_c0_g1_i1.p1  ORF type:complete len:380 (-),score=16.14 TRINITY_DN1135_c0_g1_i1:198-1337(-)
MTTSIFNYGIEQVVRGQRLQFQQSLIRSRHNRAQRAQIKQVRSESLELLKTSPMHKSERKISKQLLLDALKLPIYSVAIIPVLVSAAVANYQFGALSYSKMFGLLIAGCLVISWLNLSNDAFDSKTGVDVENYKPESVVQIFGNPNLVLAVATFFLLCGVSLLLAVITSGSNFAPAYLLTCSICMGYIYQGPPFRLSYKGLGEPLCFFAFGPFATCAFYLTLVPQFTQQISTVSKFSAIIQWIQNNGLIFGTSILVGLTTTSILLCSHFHQIEGDKKAGKFSPLVRMGPKLAYQVLFFGVIGTYVLAAFFCYVGWMPLGVFGVTVFGSFFAAFELLDFGRKNFDDPVVIKPFKKYAAKWHILFNFSVCLGFVISKLLNI